MHYNGKRTHSKPGYQSPFPFELGEQVDISENGPIHYDPYDRRSNGYSLANTFFKWEEYTPTSPVPIPGAVWLMGSGLLGLMGIARQNKSQVVT